MLLAVETLRWIRAELVGALLVAAFVLSPAALRAEEPGEPAEAGAGPKAGETEGTEENMEAVEKVTALNKKALEAYENLEFEEARKLLKQALDLAGSSGLDKHVIMARTHLHMGVILIGGLKQKDLGLKQFRKALDIQPDIKVTKSLANPDIEAAFDEARKGGGGESGGATAPSPGGGAGAVAEPEPESTGPLKHRPITQAKKGSAIIVTATVDPTLEGYEKLVLAYRPEGSPDYFARDMVRSGDSFGSEIPANATAGNLVTYYIEAVAADEEETVVASSGSEEKPHSVMLRAPGQAKAPDAGQGDCEDGEDCDDDDGDGHKFYLALTGGMGFGYVTGFGEMDVQHRVNPAGFSPFPILEIAPEAGYMLSPNFRLSLQVSIQRISGGTSFDLMKDQERRMATGQPLLTAAELDRCGADRVCSSTNGAVMVLARATWLFGSGALRPYFTGALGGGQLRHKVEFSSNMDCGPNADQTCVDTVLAGPIFAGPGGGVQFALARNVGLVAELASLVAFPNFTFHLNLHAGVSASF